jgi:transposase
VVPCRRAFFIARFERIYRDRVKVFRPFLVRISLLNKVLLKRLAIRLGLEHHKCMNAYSEDLRKKIVEAKERGMPTLEVARTFGVGISSVKRYAKTAREGGSLRPKSSPGRPPKADERARRLLEADLQERPAATLPERREYLRGVAGLRVSESTVSRLLRRMGWSRKKDRWERRSATSS